MCQHVDTQVLGTSVVFTQVLYSGGETTNVMQVLRGSNHYTLYTGSLQYNPVSGKLSFSGMHNSRGSIIIAGFLSGVLLCAHTLVSLYLS